jgi:AcrR family transcriptional regulator
MNVERSGTTTLGRPRSPETSQGVLDSVLELLSDGATLSSLSLVTIARHAGVSRNSVYRRWNTKEELYTDVVKSMSPPHLEAVGFSARENLVSLLHVVFNRQSDRRLSGFERAINAESKTYAEVFGQYKVQIVDPLETAIRMAIRRGKESGEIRVDVDESLLVGVLVSPLIARMFGPARERNSMSVSQRITDLVFDGVSP